MLKEGTCPSLVIEIVSPESKENDLDKKVNIYKKAQVEEYLIINPNLKDEQVDYEIAGYRLIGNSYRKIKPDKQGRYLSKSTQILFGTNTEKDRLQLWDANTGEELLVSREETEEARAAEAKARFEAEAKARAAEARAEAEAKIRAKLEKQLQELLAAQKGK